MSDPAEAPQEDSPKAANKQEKSEDITVLARVIVPRLEAAGGVAAKGKVLKLKESTATFHEKRKEVLIIGTA